MNKRNRIVFWAVVGVIALPLMVHTVAIVLRSNLWKMAESGGNNAVSQFSQIQHYDNIAKFAVRIMGYMRILLFAAFIWLSRPKYKSHIVPFTMALFAVPAVALLAGAPFYKLNMVSGYLMTAAQYTLNIATIMFVGLAAGVAGQSIWRLVQRLLHKTGAPAPVKKTALIQKNRRTIWLLVGLGLLIMVPQIVIAVAAMQLEWTKQLLTGAAQNTVQLRAQVAQLEQVLSGTVETMGYLLVAALPIYVWLNSPKHRHKRLPFTLYLYSVIPVMLGAYWLFFQDAVIRQHLQAAFYYGPSTWYTLYLAMAQLGGFCIYHGWNWLRKRVQHQPAGQQMQQVGQ